MRYYEEIYINGKKIKLNYYKYNRYKSNKKGNIQVKFIFNKLLNSTCGMFYKCFSLQSINSSSFNTTNVENMKMMFDGCSSLQSINLSSLILLMLKICMLCSLVVVLYNQ